MINIDIWTDQFIRVSEETFGSRVYFAGLQGSYGRGEANETSDIDIVVILDQLTAEDIRAYNDMLDSLPHRDQICGFLSGKDEILMWEPSDLFQFYHDTKPLQGTLDELASLLDDTAVSRAIKIGACNIYHGCVHNMLHEKSNEILRSLYKSASFVIQAIHFQQTGNYIRRQAELRKFLAREEQEILDTFEQIKNGTEIQLQEMSECLFAWAKKWIKRTK